MEHTISQIRQATASCIAKPVLKYLEDNYGQNRYRGRLREFDAYPDIATVVDVLEKGSNILRRIFPRKIVHIVYSAMLDEVIMMESCDPRISQETLEGLLSKGNIKRLIRSGDFASQGAVDYLSFRTIL